MSSDTSKDMRSAVFRHPKKMHNAIKNIDKGLFPQAFCKIVPDYLTQTKIIADDHAC
jgi:phosphoribosylformylglycinamidine cyclo-ligase